MECGTPLVRVSHRREQSRPDTAVPPTDTIQLKLRYRVKTRQNEVRYKINRNEGRSGADAWCVTARLPPSKARSHGCLGTAEIGAG